MLGISADGNRCARDYRCKIIMYWIFLIKNFSTYIHCNYFPISAVDIGVKSCDLVVKGLRENIFKIISVVVVCVTKFA